LPTPPRGGGAGHSGGVRRYGEPDVHRLRFIRKAQSAGFTLEQISELLVLDATEDRARARALAKARIADLDAKIRELKRARDALLRLARRCAASTGPCPIIAAFNS
jgi:MerR family mercuric resistance operon transcriptional regulator